MRIEPPPGVIREFTAEWRRWLYRLWVLEDWSAVVSFSNSWANTGSPYYDAGYYKDSYGIVRLRGRIETGTSGMVAFTLPSGYRPNATMEFEVSGGTVQIQADGDVIPTTGGAIHLDGINFRAEA